jgi:hypothetical protein
MFPTLWSDIMTYNCFEWLSDYTYKAILARLQREETPLGFLATVSQAGSDNIRVLAKLNMTTQSVRLGPFWHTPGLLLTSRPASSPYSIDLEDAKGKLLARYPFRPRESSDIGRGKDRRALVAEVVPYAPHTARIVISRDGQRLSSRSVSPNPPVVQVLYPKGGETLRGKEVTVKWRMADSDGDQLVSTLFYSTDAGKTWQAIGSHIEGPEYTLYLADLPGSNYARFRVMTTDGVNTSTDDSDKVFRVPLHPPQVRIVSPVNSASFLASQTIVLVGEAFDREDGNLDGQNLQWESEGYGVLGYGRSVALPPLSPGTHTIVLSAKDKDGMVGTANVTIEMSAVPPIANAGVDQMGYRGSVVQLDGTNSSVVGQPTFQWDFISKPNGSKASISSASFAKAEFTPDALGSYVVQLIVRDAMGAFATDNIAVFVNDKKSTRQKE